MSKKRKNVNNARSNKNTKEIKNYRNPIETVWGKVIVWALLIGMVGTVIIGLIIALINI